MIAYFAFVLFDTAQVGSGVTVLGAFANYHGWRFFFWDTKHSVVSF